MIPKTILTLALLLGVPALAGADEPRPVTTSAPRPVDVVICLDTSGSMDGLIDACRKKLWDLCSVLAQARPAPKLRIALVTYGDDVFVKVPFTDDLDKVYEELMALRTAGGTELVGRAVRRSLDQLAWSDDRGALKLMFVAGNESADQDREVPFRAVCKEALQKSIVVHAIYCGPDATDGDAGTYREVALHGGGEYAAIDQGNTVSIETPFDGEMVRLSAALNETYLAYGAQGRRGAQNQVAQDANSSGFGSSTGAARAEAKASGVYSNGGWDLCDKRAEADFDWSKLQDADLPEVLRGKTAAEKDAVVNALRARRTAIQEQIKALAAKRAKFIEEELAKRAGEAGRSIDTAMTRAIRTQAEAKGFTFQ